MRDLCVHYGNYRAARTVRWVSGHLHAHSRDRVSSRALTSRARETISERVNWSRNAATGENQEINHIMQWPPSSCCCCWPGCAHTPRSFSQIPILRGIRNMLADRMDRTILESLTGEKVINIILYELGDTLNVISVKQK
jgi:hypothetical protein